MLQILMTWLLINCWSPAKKVDVDEFAAGLPVLDIHSKYQNEPKSPKAGLTPYSRLLFTLSFLKNSQSRLHSKVTASY